LITDAIKYVTSQHHNEDTTIVDRKASTNKSPAPAASIKRTAVEAYMDSMKPPATSTKRAAVTAYIDNTKPLAASPKRTDIAAYSALMAASVQRTPFGAYIDNTKPPAASPKRTPPFGAYSTLMATSVKSPPMSKREANWEAKFQLLKQFKAEFGACHFQALATHSSGKYEGIYTWVRTAASFSSRCLFCFLLVFSPCVCACVSVKVKYQRDCLKQHRTIDETKARQLMDMGVDMMTGLDEATVLPPRIYKRPNIC
jgi:hypothetical protein